METDKTRSNRIKNLQALVNSAGGNAALARSHEGIDPTYISQLINGHRSFGEVAARNMEKRLGLAPGQLDLNPSVVEPNISDLIEQIAPALLKENPTLAEAIRGLATKYVENPAEGEKIARAIKTLIGEN